MRNEVVAHVGGRPVIAMDSISLISEGDRGAIVVSGSHGGAVSAAFAALHPPVLVVFNDAGGGKSDAGRAAIAILDAEKIASATVAHTTARIGDSLDTWASGTISAVNSVGRDAGLRDGAPLRDAVEAVYGTP